MPTAVARLSQWFLEVLLIGYTAAVAFALGWLTSADAPIRDPIRQSLGGLRDLGLPTSVSYPEIEFTASIALLVPFGLLLTLTLRRRRWWVAVLTGLGLVLVAEVAQNVLLAKRAGTPRDVLAIAAGSLIGAGFGALFARWLLARSEPRSARRGYRLDTEPDFYGIPWGARPGDAGSE